MQLKFCTQCLYPGTRTEKTWTGGFQVLRMCISVCLFYQSILERIDLRVKDMVV